MVPKALRNLTPAITTDLSSPLTLLSYKLHLIFTNLPNLLLPPGLCWSCLPCLSPKFPLHLSSYSSPRPTPKSPPARVGAGQSLTPAEPLSSHLAPGSLPLAQSPYRIECGCLLPQTGNLETNPPHILPEHPNKCLYPCSHHRSGPKRRTPLCQRRPSAPGDHIWRGLSAASLGPSTLRPEGQQAPPGTAPLRAQHRIPQCA